MNPGTQTFNTPYPRFNVQLTGTRRTDMAGLRLDYQLSPRTRLMTRGNVFTFTNPYEAQQTGQQVGGHPASVESFRRHSEELFATLTQVRRDASTPWDATGPEASRASRAQRREPQSPDIRDGIELMAALLTM